MVRDEPCRLPVRLARNERLEAAIKPELMLASLDSMRSGRPARRFRDFMWSTIDSWSRNRRVVGKAEVTGGDANPRFVVTSLKSTEIAKSILQASPNLKGMFGANEGSAIGVVNGAREMKRKIVIVGYDSGKQQKDAIMSGAMAGAITQNPVGIGYKTVEAAVKALKGEKLPKVIDTGFYWYDKSNIADPKIAAVLYD